MAMTVTVDPVRRLVITRVIGVLTLEELVAARDHARADPAFDPQFGQYMDLSELTDVAIPTPELEAMAARSVLAPGVRRAFVATTPFQFGIARMFSTFSERHGQIVQAFTNREQAEQWLTAAAGPTLGG